MLYKIALLLSILFLSGCQGLIETEVKLSDLQSKSDKLIDGDLYIQVAGCDDYADSRKPSSSVIESQQTIPYIFKDAKYVECFTKEFTSYTHFSLPLLITHNDTLVSNNYIHLISDNKNMLSIGVPPIIKQNIDRVKENSFGLNDIELDVKITVKNDLNQKVDFDIISAYINGEAVIYNSFYINPNIEFNVKLSNVSVDNALKNGISQVLMY